MLWKSETRGEEGEDREDGSGAETYINASTHLYKHAKTQAGREGIACHQDTPSTEGYLQKLDLGVKEDLVDAFEQFQPVMPGDIGLLAWPRLRPWRPDAAGMIARPVPLPFLEQSEQEGSIHSVTFRHLMLVFSIGRIRRYWRLRREAFLVDPSDKHRLTKQQEPQARTTEQCMLPYDVLPAVKDSRKSLMQPSC